MIHPELDPSRCMSCNVLLEDSFHRSAMGQATGMPLDGYDLQAGLFWRIKAAIRALVGHNNRYRVPEEVDCCTRCWHRISPDKRIEIVIKIRDRQLGGAVNIITELVHQGLLQDRNGNR